MKMKFASLFIILSAIQCSVHLVSAKQTNLLAQPKIVGGTAIKIKEIPFLLSLHLRKKFHCGASIISSSWALMALHCILPRTSENDYSLRAGSTLNGQGGSVHLIKKFYSYNSSFFDGRTIPRHDIVLVNVKRRFRFNGTVKPAKLPVEGVDLPNFLQVSGWGYTSNSIEHRGSDFILTVNVSKVEIKDCIAASPVYAVEVNEKLHLCYGGKDADACHGDSGGPLADSQTVYGIVSFGVSCGVMPGVYAKVSFYRQWIKRVSGI